MTWLGVVKQNEKVDPEKLKRDREEMERRQREGEFVGGVVDRVGGVMAAMVVVVVVSVF